MCGHLSSTADGTHLQRVIMRNRQGRGVPFTSTRMTRMQKTVAPVDEGVGKLKLPFTGWWKYAKGQSHGTHSHFL